MFCAHSGSSIAQTEHIISHNGLMEALSESSVDNASLVTGYQRSVNFRGTLDIVQPCVVTIFLCTYTSIYLNVKPNISRRYMILYKMK